MKGAFNEQINQKIITLSDEEIKKCFDFSNKCTNEGWCDIIFGHLHKETGSKCVWQFKNHAVSKRKVYSLTFLLNAETATLL